MRQVLGTRLSLRVRGRDCRIRCGRDAQKAEKNSPAPKDFPQSKVRLKPKAKVNPKEDLVLTVRQKGATPQAEVNSDETRQLVASKIDPVKIALRGMRDILCGGVVILANSTSDLERLEAEMKSTELVKYLSVSRPRRRTPEIIDSSSQSVDSNLPETDIMPAILE